MKIKDMPLQTVQDVHLPSRVYLTISYYTIILPAPYKVVTCNFLRRFCSNILFKILILFLIVIVIVSFGWLALFRHTYNRCELLCNFIITQPTLNKDIHFNSIHIEWVPASTYLRTILSTYMLILDTSKISSTFFC